ncbi:MAG: shikimate kinase [Flavobacteriaceae bacterium]|nr:shikimate kinase [Flavobacteriaceae bacterium]|tara:strand:+ start:136 stop:666 length:531 start_codon:yes stop_codon:yes gene_type:complete
MINYSIILIGYMGVGKSYIGRKLSKEFMIDFFDLDSYIESYEKKSISDIFFERGEIYFRNIENKYLESILDKNIKYVISTGGGTPCYSNNIELIKNNKQLKSFYLKSSSNQLTNRLFYEKEKRPLISNINSKKDLNSFISKHLFERNVFYNQADYIIDIENKNTSEVISEIKEKLT